MMGSDIGIKIKKVVVISIRGGYRSACNHPFLLGFFVFLVLLYRSFPFLFSVLVSASPVLVCTAILLGTLLSFGQPNVPEVEIEEKVTSDISSFQAGFSEGNTVFAERDESYFVKGYSENRSDVEERGFEEASLVTENEKDSRIKQDGGLLSELPPDDEKLPDIQPEKQEIGEVVTGREFRSFESGKNVEVQEENLTSEAVSSDDEAIEKQYVMVQKVNDDIEFENEKTLGDHVDFSASSSWKLAENNDDDDDDSVESGSDGAESSSPDASMADIIPILDELHPLLDLDAPQPAHVSRDGSDAASEKSDDDSVESDDDTENNCDAEDEGIDERDDEEEEVTGGKDDESKSAIKWTEDDQRNLMDLGNLELERNKRLENLIARRRARRLMTEKNLIDLDFADIPCNVAPIATMIRRNPFDFPDDSYADMGLPPIPGSAPSILQPRQNPFDIPYDSSEEKPDLKGDSFQQEFTGSHQKEAFFRRHESFSTGPSVLGFSKQERYDWKPVFISERMASEGTSYSFNRQSSGVSDSKMSSVPDTESVSSIDQDDRKFSEQDLSQETELMSNTDHASDVVERGSQSSGENDSVEIIQAEESNVRQDEVEIVLGGVEDPSEMLFYPETGEVETREQFNEGATHLRREPSDEESGSSHSSVSEVIDNIPDEKMESTENLQQENGHLSESQISTHASVEESDFQHVSTEVEDIQPVDPVYDSSPQASETLQSSPSISSHGSATEFSERALPPVSVETTATVADKESEVHDHRVEVNTFGHEKTQAASSELHAEAKNELRSEKSEDMNNVTTNELSAVASSSVDQSGSTVAEPQVVPLSVGSNLSSDVGLINDVTDSGLVDGQDLDHIHADSEILHQDNVDSPDSNYQMAPEKSHQSDNESVEEGALPDEVSRSDDVNVSASVQVADEVLDSVASDAHHIFSNGSFMPAPQDLQHSLAAGQAPVVHPNLPSEETDHIEKTSLNNNDGMSQTPQDEVLSSSLEQGKPDIHQDLEKNMVDFPSSSQDEIDVKTLSNLENHLSSSDKSVVAQSSSDHDSSNAIPVESAQGFGTLNEDRELHDATDKFVPSTSTLTFVISDTPEFRSPTGEVDLEVDRHREAENKDQNEALFTAVPSEEDMSALITAVPSEEDMSTLVTAVPSEEEMSQASEESSNDFDEMKEIDEEFLSELDTVGDFSVSDAGVSVHTDIEHEKTKDAKLSSPKDVKIEDVEQDIPFLEARSLDDINLAFKQLQEGVDVEEVILPSTIKDQHVNEESKDHLEADSDIQVVEARSLDDINIALKQVSEGNKGEQSNSLDLKDTSAKVEENEAGSAKVNEFTNVATSSEELSKIPADKLENVTNSSSGKKGKSHSRKSSSSSSSSSSDSD